MEICKFYDGKNAQCMWQGKVREFLKPTADKLQHRFNMGENVDADLLLVRRAPDQIPSMGNFENQHAYVEGLLRCTGSQKDGYNYLPVVEKQIECDGYVSNTGSATQEGTSNNIPRKLSKLSPRLLPPQDL